MTSEDHPYRNPALPVEERIQDLLGRMTLEEKAAQTASPFGSAVDVHNPPPTGWGSATAALSTLGLPPREAAEKGNELQRKHVEDTRLGIPVLLAEEALIGLKVQDATTYPDAIAQAATWEPELIEEMSRAIGLQMTRMGVRQALSPLADVARDPRWGRVEETYGEEPYLVGSMATAFVRGLQDTTDHAPVIATLKHFIGYGASDGGRNTDPAQIGQNELREVHGVPFEMAIRTGGAKGVMPAYNTLDGVPVTGSKKYLTDLLRTDYGFDGLITSDLNAVSQLYTKHGTAANNAEAFAQALRAGVDLDLDNAVNSDHIAEAVRTGVLAEADLDRAVASVLRAKFRLGLFEQPYANLDEVPETLDTDQERALARKLAEKAVVLLQNKPVNGTPLLPLRQKGGTIAVIGPNADRAMGQLGNYSYQVLDSMTKRFALAADPQARLNNSEAAAAGADGAELLVKSVPVVTFLEGIRRRAGADTNVLYERGCPVAAEDRSGFDAAVAAAQSADVAVLVVGDQAGIGSYGTVGEGLDSTDCALPGVQREMVEAVIATGTPTVVVLSHGRPYALGWMTQSVPAILTSFFGGEEAGNAVASVIFGDVNPAGRLPMAMLQSAAAAPLPYWRTLQQSSYFDSATAAVFPFGHGLSYTEFLYRDLVVSSQEVATDSTIQLTFTVTNVGDTAGEEVVQVYGRDVIGRTARRGRILAGFRRIALVPGAAAKISVDVPASMFALWDSEDGWVVEPGMIRFYVGASSANTPLQTKVMLTGNEHFPGPDRDLFSTVSVEIGEYEEFAAQIAATLSSERAPVLPVTAESTIRDWLDHPVGGDLLRAMMGGVDEDMLASAMGMTLKQVAYYSQGQISDSVVDDLVAKAQYASEPGSA
ncbi:glycoside hydrolase family 3 N-terminal domain-containing protein [Paenarthrobacter aromaticivorans]|uniref:glycoside hydrolase family 3 N-terminal domain-containing protein n=1 Tax=Paenarthrobacter aromaticivorans TaxID=2849150 RepID=UPI003A80CFF8